MRAEGHRGRISDEGPDVVGVGCDPPFAIGQRALLLRAESGNVLWDCISYLDDDLARQIAELGGVSAMAISHPHFYGSMIEWSRAFEAPVFIHRADQEWVGRPDPSVEFWDGPERQLAPDITLINLGVHFAGGTVLHRAASDGRPGALFSGDIVQVVMDRRWVSFMYSYPNLIPERPEIIRQALTRLEPYDFDRIYGAWWGRIVLSDGPKSVRRSAERYLRFATGTEPGPGA
jgi:glyoxylase-like metal-dependent hydrolase (beta-lactamase superfamily II)